MSARAKLLAMLAGVVLLASASTHGLVRLLDIRTTAGTGHKHFGNAKQEAKGLILGSSLTYSAVDWMSVASHLQVAMKSWPVPGSSPAEWEQMQRRSPQASMTFVGVSVYDLNEVSVCEYRANIVPLRRTVEDLWASRADGGFARRVLSDYPMTWSRAVFPTAGLSDHVIFGFRDEARRLVARPGQQTDTADERLSVASDFVSADALSDWPRDRLLRRLAVMRGSQGRPWFSGPKHLALIRLLQQARRQGSATVVVLPVSPLYNSEVVTAEDVARFQASVDDAKRAVPEATWVHYDELAAMNSNDCFSDLVHANRRGRSVITPEFLKSLNGAAGGR
jgi:hypothetical protein